MLDFLSYCISCSSWLERRGKLSALLLLFKGLALSFYILWKKKLFILPSTGFVCWLVLFWWKQLFHVLYWGRTVYFLCGCVRCGRPLSAICELRIKFYYKLLFCFFCFFVSFFVSKESCYVPKWLFSLSRPFWVWDKLTTSRTKDGLTIGENRETYRTVCTQSAGRRGREIIFLKTTLTDK